MRFRKVYTKGQTNTLESVGEAKKSSGALLKPVMRQLEGTWAWRH